MHQDATWHGRPQPQPRRLCLIWDPASLPKKRHSPPIFGPCLLWPNGYMYQDTTWYGPQFSANVRCGQMAGWTKMQLGMEVGLRPDDFVFDGDPATQRKKGHSPHPIFGPCLLWPNGWTEVNLSPSDVVLDGGPDCPMGRGNFGGKGRLL